MTTSLHDATLRPRVNHAAGYTRHRTGFRLLLRRTMRSDETVVSACVVVSPSVAAEVGMEAGGAWDWDLDAAEACGGGPTVLIGTDTRGYLCVAHSPVLPPTPPPVGHLVCLRCAAEGRTRLTRACVAVLCVRGLRYWCSRPDSSAAGSSGNHPGAADSPGNRGHSGVAADDVWRVPPPLTQAPAAPQLAAVYVWLSAAKSLAATHDYIVALTIAGNIEVSLSGVAPAPVTAALAAP